MSRELLQRVNAMLTYGISDSIDELKKDIDAELAKPLPEPMGYINPEFIKQENWLSARVWREKGNNGISMPLYTSAPDQGVAMRYAETLKCALEKLLSVAEQCDSWESFPSKALDEAQYTIDDYERLYTSAPEQKPLSDDEIRHVIHEYYHGSSHCPSTIGFVRTVLAKNWRHNSSLAQRLQLALNPQQWTQELHDLWHKSLPDTELAFYELRKWANDSEEEHQEQSKPKSNAIKTVIETRDKSNKTQFITGDIIGYESSPNRLIVVGEDDEYLHTYIFETEKYYSILKKDENLSGLIRKTIPTIRRSIT